MLEALTTDLLRQGFIVLSLQAATIGMLIVFILGCGFGSYVTARLILYKVRKMLSAEKGTG